MMYNPRIIAGCSLAFSMVVTLVSCGAGISGTLNSPIPPATTSPSSPAPQVVSIASSPGNTGTPDCGAAWLSSLQQLSKLPSDNPVDDIQILSWNNYERGSQIEAGVDNCVSITPTVAADTLTWQVTGNVGTVDHYAVYTSTDGTTMTLVAKTLPDTNSLALDTLNLATDKQFAIYVQAVGKPSVLNKLSSPASYSPASRHAPVIQLTVSPTAGVAPLAVDSSLTISGRYTSSSIDFGDGTIVNGVSAFHSYATSGRYNVKATVTNRGLSSSATATVTVTAPANQPPVVKLSVTPTSGTVPVTVNASTAGSSDPDGSIASTKIDFGDGTIVSAASASHIYVTAGTYTVKATVTDNRGLSSLATATVTVTATANQPPVAKLTVTPTSGTVPVTVNASTAGSIDPDGSIASTKIDFGDGTIVSAASASHIYVTAGTYTVKATVTDNGGLSSSATATVTSSVSSLPPGSQMTHGITIPTTRPRLWFDSARLATAKTWYSSHPITISGDNMRSYEQAALKGLLGNDASSCQLAVDWAVSFDPTTTSTSSQADWMRWYGEQAIVTYDWCYNTFTSGQRTAFIGKMNTWFDFMISTANAYYFSVGSPIEPQNNYFWGFVRNEIEWAIVSYAENTVKAESYLDDALINRWAGHALPAATTSSKGGVTQEGTQYGPYMSWYVIMPFETAGLLGRDLYSESNFYKENVFATIYASPLAATYTVNGTTSNNTTNFEVFPFSDSEIYKYGGTAKTAYLGDLMSRAASRWSSLNVGKYARSWLGVVTPTLNEWTASLDTGGSSLPLSNLPLDYYASGPAYLYSRKAWDTASTILNLQLSMPVVGTASHVHDDAGNWQLWRGGRWVSRETVGYSNTFTGYNNSGTTGSSEAAAHNVLLFNGIGYGGTCSPACLITTRNGPPIVNRMESASNYAYADVDLSAAYRNNIATGGGYPQRENPAVAHAEREFIFVRDLETLVIFDRLQSNSVGTTVAANITKTFLAHCEVIWTLEDAQHATCTDGDQALRLTTLVPSAPTYVVVNERGDNVGQYRLEVNDSGSAQSYFLTVLQSKSSVAVNLAPSVVDNGSSYTIMLDGKHSITLNKGMRSAGGSVTISGATTNLRSDVQAMSVTDSGPVWATVQ